MEKTLMTREGFNKMTEDLRRLKQLELKECLQNLVDARDKGDLSENAEYEVAKQSLEDLNAKLAKLGNILDNSQIVEPPVDNGTVQMLTWVKFRNLTTKSEIEYRIVPEHEIDIKAGRISHLSPIGKSLMNKKVGDKFQVTIPAGILDLEVINIRVK